MLSGRKHFLPFPFLKICGRFLWMTLPPNYPIRTLNDSMKTSDLFPPLNDDEDLMKTCWDWIWSEFQMFHETNKNQTLLHMFEKCFCDEGEQIEMSWRNHIIWQVKERVNTWVCLQTTNQVYFLFAWCETATPSLFLWTLTSPFIYSTHSQTQPLTHSKAQKVMDLFDFYLLFVECVVSVVIVKWMLSKLDYLHMRTADIYPQ